MNDQELDELLDTWVTPPVPPALRENAQRQFVAHIKRKRFAWTMPRPGSRALWFAFGSSAFLFMLSQAFPHIILPLIGPNFTVDAEEISYRADGKGSIDRYTTSFVLNGRFQVVTAWVPGQPFKTVRYQLMEAAVIFASKVAEPFLAKRQSEPEDWCRALPGLAHETLLGYETVIIPWGSSKRENERTLAWQAPDLSCLTLQRRYEVRGADGKFRLESETRAFRVNRR